MKQKGQNESMAFTSISCQPEDFIAPVKSTQMLYFKAKWVHYELA